MDADLIAFGRLNPNLCCGRSTPGLDSYTSRPSEAGGGVVTSSEWWVGKPRPVKAVDWDRSDSNGEQ
jgi:hypothetical protein